ncbi:MAG TPA: threonine/serine dehydratase [Cytophagales bacterium]|nr:threonine/serine dehydratase [Cytophagales bacterium]
MKFPSIDDFNNTLSDINKYIHKTPIVSSSSLNKIYNSNIFFKLELFQKTGSFKTRGAINKLLKLSDLERNKGVITISAGNHAQAISWACSQFNIKSKIVMPFDASPSKVEATKSYGGEVILTKNSMMDECNDIKEREGLTFVHPFDDIDIILGQGTVGLEIIEKLNNIDYAFISIGGGGLISGIACVLKSINPKIKIIGVEPINSNVMTKSISSNKPETFDTNINKTIADGLAAPFAGNLTFEFVKKYVDEIINVSENEMIESMRVIIERLKVIPEAAASACFVPILKNKLSIKKNTNSIIVLCGGNIDLDKLKKLF